MRMHAEAVEWTVPHSLRGSVASVVGYRSKLPPSRLHRGLPSPHLTVILTFGNPLRMLSHPTPEQPAASFVQLIGLHDTLATMDMGGHQAGIQPPKAVTRVGRFDAARKLLVRRQQAGVPLDLAELAVLTGFFDQVHLARKWVRIAGLSPTAWLSEEFRSVQAGEPAVAGG